MKEGVSKGGGQEQPEEISSSNILSEEKSEAQPAVEIETECKETAETESPLVPSGDSAEVLKVVDSNNLAPIHSNEVEKDTTIDNGKYNIQNAKDAESLAQEVGEQSLTHDANQSVIESLPANGSSEEDESFVPETQFDTTNDMEMKSSNFSSFANGQYECNDSIQNNSCENHEMRLVDEFITETSDQMEHEETKSDLAIVNEKPAGTYLENVPNELTEPENDIAIAKGKYKFQLKMRLRSVNFHFLKI